MHLSSTYLYQQIINVTLKVLDYKRNFKIFFVNALKTVCKYTSLCYILIKSKEGFSIQRTFSHIFFKIV